MSHAEAGDPIWRASGGGPLAPPPTRMRNVPAIAVCVGAGLMLISAGEFMYRWPTTEPVVSPVVAPVTLATAGPSPGDNHGAGLSAERACNPRASG